LKGAADFQYNGKLCREELLVTFLSCWWC